MKKLLLIFAALCCTVMMKAKIQFHQKNLPTPTLWAIFYAQDCWEDTETGKFYEDEACQTELNPAEIVLYHKIGENPIVDESQRAEDGEYGGTHFYYPAVFKNFDPRFSDKSVTFRIQGDGDITRPRLKVYIPETMNLSDNVGIEVKINGTKVRGEKIPNTGLLEYSLPTVKFDDIVTCRIYNETDKIPESLGVGDISVCLDYLPGTKITIVADNKVKIVDSPDPKLTYKYTRGLLLDGMDWTSSIKLSRDSGKEIGTYTIHVSTENPTLIKEWDITWVEGTLSIIKGQFHEKCEATPGTIGYSQDCWENDNEENKLYADGYCEQELNYYTTKTYANLKINPVISEGVTVKEDVTYRGAPFHWAAVDELDDPIDHDFYSRTFTMEFKVFGTDVDNARLKWMIDGSYNANCNITYKFYINNNEIYSKEYYEYKDHPVGVFLLPLDGLKKGDVVKIEMSKDYGTVNGTRTFAACLEYTRSHERSDIILTADNKQKFKGTEDPEFTWHTKGEIYKDVELKNITFQRESNENPGTYNLYISQAEGANPDYDITFIDGKFQIIDSEHHDKSEEPTYRTIGFLRECWKNLENGKWYIDAYGAIEESLDNLICYKKLVNNPVIENIGFQINEDSKYAEIPFNWIAETTFNVNDAGTTRSVVFAVNDEEIANARLAYHRSDEFSKFTFKLYVNDELYNERNDNGTDLKYIQLPELKTGDLVKFEIYSDELKRPCSIAACLQYTSSTGGIDNMSMDIKLKQDETKTLVLSSGSKVSFSSKKNNNLKQSSDPGTIGMHHGREAIVVDLGDSIGKVAIATMNVGATKVTSPVTDNDDCGTFFTAKDANDPVKNGLDDGWYVPSLEELEALVEKLDFINGQETGPSLHWYNIKYSGNTLYLPGYYTKHPYWGDMYSGTYWGKENCTEGKYKYAYIDFGLNDTRYKYAEEYECDEDMEGLLRPFCKLDDDEWEDFMFMSAENKTFDAASDIILSFTGKKAAKPSLRLSFNNDTAPIEIDHAILSSTIKVTDRGKNITLTVNDRSVTYATKDIKDISFLYGTPSVKLKAKEDPKNEGIYYTTFYSSLESYSVPEGFTAYRGQVEDGNVINLTPVKDGIMARGEGYVLRGTAENCNMQVAENPEENEEENILTGTDLAIEMAPRGSYVLSNGPVYGVGFYQWYVTNYGKPIGANKAYLIWDDSKEGAKAFTFKFDDGEVNAIHNAEFIMHNGDENLYNLNGVRVNDSYKGIVVKNGKKYYNK